MLYVGQVVLHDIHGKIVRNFLLLDVITAVEIVECHFWGNGVVALTSDMQLHVAEAIIWYYAFSCDIASGLWCRRSVISSSCIQLKIAKSYCNCNVNFVSDVFTFRSVGSMLLNLSEL